MLAEAVYLDVADKHHLQVLLLEDGVATKAETEAIEEKVRQRIEDAVDFARESPEPDLATLEDDVYA